MFMIGTGGYCYHINSCTVGDFYPEYPAADPVCQDCGQCHCPGRSGCELDYRSANELGQLAEDIRKTASALKFYVEEIRQGMSAVGRGKLNYETRADFKGDFIALGESLNEISRLLRESIAQISSSAEQISVGAEQVSNGAQVLAR